MASGSGTPRTGRTERLTPRTKVLVEIALDGTGISDIETGVAFLDQVLAQFGQQARFDLTVHAVGGGQADVHHVVQECAIALGEAFRQAIGDPAFSQRYGDAFVPVRDALAHAVVDLGGGPYVVHSEPELMDTAVIAERFPATLVRMMWESFAYHAGVTLHVVVSSGRDAHTVAEAQFNAVGRALRTATRAHSKGSAKHTSGK